MVSWKVTINRKQDTITNLFTYFEHGELLGFAADVDLSPGAGDVHLLLVNVDRPEERHDDFVRAQVSKTRPDSHLGGCLSHLAAHVAEICACLKIEGHGRPKGVIPTTVLPRRSALHGQPGLVVSWRVLAVAAYQVAALALLT
jgi:hypothetical protein